MKTLKFSILLIVVFAQCASFNCLRAASGNVLNDIVFLCGDQVVPPVETDATGTFQLELNEDNTMHFALSAIGLSSNITRLSLHLGDCGNNGTILVDLLGPCTPEETPIIKKLIAEATIQAQDLKGPLEGESLDDLCTLIQGGGAYMTVHTVTNPAGEIRGQLGDPECPECQPPDTLIPTLSQWSFIILILGLMTVGIIALRQKVYSIR